MAKQVTVEIKALPGERVWVRNYRRKNRKTGEMPWESGTVTGTRAVWNELGNYHIQYEVTLDRRTGTGKWIFLTVGDDRLGLETTQDILKANVGRVAEATVKRTNDNEARQVTGTVTGWAGRFFLETGVGAYAAGDIKKIDFK